MALQFRKASRKKVKIKLQLGAPSGGGKTFSALRLAYGLCGDWNKIAVIDSENGSSELYVGKDGIGEFNVVPLDSFTEKDYIGAINLCEKEGMEVVIIDTSSKLWDYVKDLHQKLGGQFHHWGEPKRKYRNYVNTMLQCNMHILSTVRKDEEYVMEKTDVNGREKVEIKKKGLKENQEKSMNYEFTVVFDIEQDTHLTTTSKDRTGLFDGNAPFLITEETGKKIKEWCEEGTEQEVQVKADISEALAEIDNASSVEVLKEIITKYPHLKSTNDFIEKIKEKNKELTTK